MLRALVRLIAASLTALTVVSCGSGVGVTLKVGSISTANGARSVQSGRSVPTDAVQSTTEYGFAKVDGIKLSLNKLQAITGSNESTIVEWSPAKEVTVAPGTNNTLAVTETASVTAGSYSGVKIRYANSYSVKAFCRTATKFVYTTATEVKTVALPVTTMPTDYDYFAYPFSEITTATSLTSNGETQSETHGNFTVTDVSSLSLAVLFDPSYLVTCYDGTTTVGGGNTNALSPFVWSNNNGLATTDFFPDNKANFGMGYLPVFIWVSTDPSEALPTAETYASSTTAGNVTGSTLDYRQLAITSFAFRADGSLLDARARISSGGSSGEVQQFFSDFSNTGTTYSFKNGEWTCNADYSSCRPIQDRAMTGFTRTTDFTTTSSSTFGDATDCGSTITYPSHPEWGNQARACLGTATTMTWRQLVR